MEKEQLRRLYLMLRALLSDEEKEEKNRAGRENILKVIMERNPKTVFSFISFRNEIDTIEIIKHLLKNGIEVCVPYVDAGSKTMIASLIDDVDSCLEKNNMGIFEPKKEFIREVKSEQIGIIIVPGITFDLKGFRVGFGAGYYDKYIGALKSKIFKIGYCYDFQVVEKIKTAKHDKPVDCIATDKRVIFV